jgi:hypothetical protein
MNKGRFLVWACAKELNANKRSRILFFILNTIEGLK